METSKSLASVKQGRGAGNEFFVRDLVDQSQVVRENVLIWAWLRDKAPNTQKTYANIVRSFFERYPGVSLKAVTTSHVTAFIFEHLSGMSRKSQELYLNTLASLFTFCHREGYLERSPCLPIKKIRVDRLESMKLPTTEQIEHLFKSVQNYRNLMILKVLYYTGLRVSELCGLKWGDFSAQKNGVKIITKGKGQKVRAVMVSFALFEEIQRLSEDEKCVPTGLIFKSAKLLGKSISIRQVERICADESIKARLSIIINPHAFRHAHATHALKKGAPLDLVQKNLGHTTIQTTAIYLHADMNDSSGFYL